MDKIYKDLSVTPEYSGGISGATEEMNKMFSSFLMAFALAFLFKYMILAAQFESYTHPVAIIISLPLTLPFVIPVPLNLMLTASLSVKARFAMVN